jgi:DNA-binding FadR family transcriptional regulator
MMKERTYPRRGLHGQVVHDLGLGIVSGEIAPGDKLPIDEEAAASRTVLREAVKVLAAKGLVQSRPKTGTRVRERRYWNLMDPDVLLWRLEADTGDAFLLDVFEVRERIEPAAAALAAKRATPGAVEELAAAFAEMQDSYGDIDRYVAADLGFHAVILEACGNELLEQIGSTLRAVFRVSFARTAQAPGSSERALPLHGDVLEAIRAGDADAAELAMLDLIRTTAELLGAVTTR